MRHGNRTRFNCRNEPAERVKQQSISKRGFVSAKLD
jgi:hypothetical protein